MIDEISNLSDIAYIFSSTNFAKNSRKNIITKSLLIICQRPNRALVDF